MAKRVERQELIDIDGLRQSIAEVKSDYTSFASEVAKLNATMQRSAQNLQADLSKLLQMNNSGASLAQMQEYAQRATALGERLKDLKAAQEGLTKTEQQHTQAVQSLIQRQEQLLNQYSQIQGNSAKEIQQRKQLAGELAKLQGEYGRLDKVIKINSTSTKELTGTYNRLEKDLSDAKKELKSLDGAFDSSTGKINTLNKRAVELTQTIQRNDLALKEIDKSLGNFGRNAGNYPKGGSGSAGVLGMLGEFGIATSIGGAVAVLGAAAKGIADVGMEYEKLNALTESALNNNKKAAVEASALIKNFADSSPREIEEVTMAFNRMVDVGIIPTKEQLTEISDIAATKNKTMMDYVEAIADAQMGEFERLKEFSIDASKSGDKIIFTFKGVRTEVDNNATAINNYLLGLGKVPGVMGTTEKLAAQLSGRLSTMWDNVKGIANDIYQMFLPALNAVAGVLGSLIGLIGTVVSGMRQMAQEQGILVTIGKFMASPFQAATEAYQAGSAQQQQQANAGTPELDKARREMAAQAKANEAKRKAEEAKAKAKQDAEKAKQEAEKAQKEQQELERAQFAERQAVLAAQYEDGLIDQRQFLAKKLALTKEGIDKEAKLLTGSSREQHTQRIKLNRDRIDAEREYKRELLKMNIGNNKVSTDKQLSALDAGYEAGPQTLEAEADYINKRLKIQQDGILREQELLRKAGKEKTDEYKKTEEELEKIATDYLKRRKKIQEESFKRAVDAVSAEIDKDKSGLEGQLATRLADLQKAYSDEETVIKGQMAKRQITEEQGEERLANLKLKLLQDIADATKANNDLIVTMAKTRLDNLANKLRAEGATELEILKALEKERQDIEKERLDAIKKNADQEVNINETKNQNKQQSDQRTAEKKAALEEKAFELTNAAVNASFDIASSFRERDIENLEKQKQNELSMAGDNSAKKEEIEKKYADKQRAIRRQQAVADKAQALFNIVLNTAMGVSKAFSTPYLIPYIVALGAIQAGVVAAKPIPEFFKGTSDAPEGPAWVGERGYELIESKKGGKPHYRLAAEKQVAYLNAHDRVYTHEESKHMLQTNREIAQEVRTAPGGGLYVQPIVTGGLTEMGMRQIMNEAFENQPINQTIMDDGEMKYYLKKRDEHTRWMNSRRTLPRTKH
ncbi:hypothetical protein GCM10028807_51790 [Spirosoma daeguense]